MKITNVGMLSSCSGCGACAYVCPTSAISIDLNEDGFYYRKVDDTKCMSCGCCTKICSHANNHIEKDVVFISNAKVFKAKAVNGLDNNSSSGGISYLLMKKAIEKSKRVVGVAYDTESCRTLFDIIENDKDIERFRGSKYIQADPKPIIARLKEKKQCVFVGTPCQVYGFSSAMKIEGRSEEFLFVDFFCHGIPSYLIWEKRINELVGDRLVNSVSFRDKRYGNNDYRLCIKLKDGSEITSMSRKDDDFYRLYDSGYVLSTGCYDCPCRYTKTVADIRIGDLYDADDEEYYSRVAVCTEKGEEAFDEIRQLLEYEPTSIRLSSDIISKPALTKVRGDILDSLKSDDSLHHSLEIYLYNDAFPLFVRFKNYCKEMLKSMNIRFIS